MSFRPTRPMINCGQCGEHLFVSQWTEYVDEYRVAAPLVADNAGFWPALVCLLLAQSGHF